MLDNMILYIFLEKLRPLLELNFSGTNKLETRYKMWAGNLSIASLNQLQIEKQCNKPTKNQDY